MKQLNVVSTLDVEPVETGDTKINRNTLDGLYIEPVEMGVVK